MSTLSYNNTDERGREDMKSKGLIIAGAIVVVAIVVVVMLSNRTSKEEKVATAFIEAIESQDYDKLAPLINVKKTNDEKNSQAVVKRYKNVFSSIETTKTQVSAIKMTRNKATDMYEFSYTARFKTFLGWTNKMKYKGTVVKADGEAKVVWEPSLIIPFMSPGDKITVSNDEAIRGAITDVAGNNLADNKRQKQAGLYPKQLTEGKGKEANLTAIAALFKLEKKTLEQQLAQEWVNDESFIPLKIVPLSFKVPDDINGVTMNEVTARFYPYGAAAAHLIGYVGEVSAEDIDKEPSYKAGDLIGKAGLEATYNTRLKGKNGGAITVTNDVTGKADEIQSQKAVAGENIQLTIDAELQKQAYAQLKETVGSYTALDPKTGGLTALVSSPSYDPNEMTAGISTAAYQKLEANKKLPFLARYTARFAPGSTFKTITAAIGLDAKVIEPTQARAISGLKWQQDKSWGDYFVTRVSDVPQVNMTDALVYSDNIYFAQEALTIGQKRFEAGLEKLPFDESLKLPLEMDKAQLSNKGIDTDILLADTAYGQGELLMTPIDQVIMYSAFANDGAIVYPHLEVKDKRKDKTVFTKAAANTVTKALYETVNRTAGTAHGLQTTGQEIAAKTGTAEIKDKQDTKGDENSFVLAFDTTTASYVSVTMVEKSNENLKNKKIVELTKSILATYYQK